MGRIKDLEVRDVYVEECERRRNMLERRQQNRKNERYEGQEDGKVKWEKRGRCKISKK